MSVWDDIMDTPADAANMRIRAALLRAVREHIDTFGWSQTTAATTLGITQPRVAELMNGHISKFSLDTLVTLADQVGVHVTVEADALAGDAAMSPSEAAKLLKMSRPHLLTFMNRGLLPYTLRGTERRIRVSDLLTFMDGREKGAALVADALGDDRPADNAREVPTSLRATEDGLGLTDILSEIREERALIDANRAKLDPHADAQLPWHTEQRPDQ
ncbi:putative DNA-binding protein [Gordonia polyisoprenivorans VH2]|uniref:Putative DNA-binding protein n=1 Tax=Gordonia polyisoprenivorans (strain DSM 44266 / VH2) TaxID=1112204 RepID=H6MS08_GORPV|nr:putative DNA-binding protein [Gordonia polyisoprenivorans VH2]